jgi:hypothetical protein
MKCPACGESIWKVVSAHVSGDERIVSALTDLHGVHAELIARPSPPECDR